MAAEASTAPSAPAQRIQSVDALGGAIMILMAIDHVRDFIARSAMQFSPTDLTPGSATYDLRREREDECCRAPEATASTRVRNGVE